MEGSNNSEASSSRWTCEACGCNTNSESDRSCGICGTSNGPSLLRRVNYARPGLFARSVAARRNFLSEELGIEGYDLWERADHDADMAIDDDEQAFAALAMEVASASGSDPQRRPASEAATSMAPNRESQVSDPIELLEIARENGNEYRPKWMNPAQIGGRLRAGNCIEVGDGANQQVAHLPLGSGEGRALRALEAFPRSVPFASSRFASANHSRENRPKRAFGFRVVFEHPDKDVGEKLGGNHVIGVTTTTFASFSEKNALQNSSLFWGIEDGGRKFEGSRSNTSGDNRRGQSNWSSQLSLSEAPRNTKGGLFGSLDIITCVVEFESRSLTFWRGEDLLGTLITNLPRVGNLYPVCVPSKAGCTVTIVGLDEDPLPVLRSFSIDRRQRQLDRDSKQRQDVKEQCSLLVSGGELAPSVAKILQEIFSSYCFSSGNLSKKATLRKPEANRFWYSCDMKLLHLQGIIDSKQKPNFGITYEDFVDVLKGVIYRDEGWRTTNQTSESGHPNVFQVGDKVQLVKGYERFGDATNGPLRKGDRGTVVDVQEGPAGERHSVRVVHSNRRWYYQTQAIVREKSGLIDSPGIWFLKRVLRVHGYDPSSLKFLAGQNVFCSPWQIGDVVVPKEFALQRTTCDLVCGKQQFELDEDIGRIVAEGVNSSTSLNARSRDSGSVLVEFISRDFAEACGVQANSFSGLIETRRVPTLHLVYSTALLGKRCNGSDQENQLDSVMTEEENNQANERNNAMQIDTSKDEGNISLKLRADLDKITHLDLGAIDSVTIECRKNATALASIFEHKLTEKISTAMDVALDRVSSGKGGASLAQAVCALGRLVRLVANQAFPQTEVLAETDSAASASDFKPLPSLSDATEDYHTQRNIEQHTRNRATSTDDEAPVQDEDHPPQLSTLQQRRNMLLALMSRARRGGPENASEATSNGDNVRDSTLEDLLPALDPLHQNAAALLFPSDEPDRSTLSQRRTQITGVLEQASSTQQKASDAQPLLLESSCFLDEILRGRCSELPSTERSGMPSSSLQSCVVKCLVTNGLVGNSSIWLKAILDSQSQGSLSRSNNLRTSMLNVAQDEDGAPLLQLAIEFGCSRAITRLLIQSGCPVGDTEIRMAAYIDQSEILAELLQYSVYSEGSVNIDKCSAHITAMLEKALHRQTIQLGMIAEGAKDLSVSFLTGLYKLGLRCRQEPSEDLCSQAVAQALVGNVVLIALEKCRGNSKNEPSADASTLAEMDSGGRHGPEASEIGFGAGADGILDVLPDDIVAPTLSLSSPSLASYLLLVEDYLCSKYINDSATGLSLLLILLRRCAAFRDSTEIDRYGFCELVASHDAFASNKLAEMSVGVEKSYISCDPKSLGVNGRVLCPKEHTASLHVTRHSSFRCDLCGKGVERGQTMHGCRECDWDACESCTDSAEGGMVKWEYIKETAQECQVLLSTNHTSVETPEETIKERSESDFASTDNSADVNNLSLRIMQRDRESIKDLGVLMSVPGRLTMHQFLSVILPALHSSLLGKRAGNDDSDFDTSQICRRSKRPRKFGRTRDNDEISLYPCSGQTRLDFSREVSKHLVSGIDFSSKSDAQLRSENQNTGSGDGLEAQDRDATGLDGNMSQPLPEHQPELLRRLHQVLALYENATLAPRVRRPGMENLRAGDLQSLTKPVALTLMPFTTAIESLSMYNRQPLKVRVEPLMSVQDLSRHILRSWTICHPQYLAFCQSLVVDSAIIMERPEQISSRSQREWHLAKVLSFDNKIGCHTVQFASTINGMDNEQFDMRSGLASKIQDIQFEGKESKLILASREFCVVHRCATVDERKFKSTVVTNSLLADDIVADESEHNHSLSEDTAIGTRVVSNVFGPEWIPYTIVGDSGRQSGEEVNEGKYTLVSDEGVVCSNVCRSKLKGMPYSSDGDGLVDRRSPEERNHDMRSHASRAFPFLALRRQSVGRRESSRSKTHGVLKRNWSALSLRETMCPIDLKVGSLFNPTHWRFDLEGRSVKFLLDSSTLEAPPCLRANFSLDGSLPLDIPEPGDTTVITLLLRHTGNDRAETAKDDRVCLYFCISFEEGTAIFAAKDGSNIAEKSMTRQSTLLPDRQVPPTVLNTKSKKPDSWSPQTRSRKFVHMTNSVGSEDQSPPTSFCESLDETCIQCMELIGFLAEVSEGYDAENTSSSLSDVVCFENKVLSQRLAEQLEDPLVVVSGGMPEWCFAAPSFAPRVFSYKVRRLLLDRGGFGISRSTLRQQESKVNVGRLRQRMSSLRAKAVELVGEAFAGGAEDPTALQLQADELYGMEEALAARIRATFRAERWDERALDVAKAAVNRDLLISDAISVMDQYATNPRINRRRLEVRFDGESGFDAASGDEAGVTRGFYADVAEALLSCDVVEGVSLASACLGGIAAASSITSIDCKGKGLQCKLPLWIPDVDSSGQIVIPTPRDDPHSALGIFPRPLASSNSALTEVLDTFRFMGRLFAAAMRDGFMFPIPLSSSFLKLIQRGADDHRRTANSVDLSKPVHFQSTYIVDKANLSSLNRSQLFLTSADLPRAGFIGGEIAAVEAHICVALDRLDDSEPRLTKAELEQRYKDIANDNAFARKALGKSYDCSFEDFFEDRTFVDPLDPTQGIDAMPLSGNGHTRKVTIHNVREWVSLAKQFVLQDGVIAQALAFRQGVRDFFSPEYLCLFTAQELQRDVCGVGDSVDSWDEAAIRNLFKLDGGKGAAEALVAVAAIGGEGGAALSRRFGPSSPTITFVVRALLEGTPRMRRQFLSFVTSLPIVTPGQIEVVPVVSPSGEFLPMHDPGCLPRTNTCARRLYLPKFETYESFSQVLWAVVREESRFKGFYEWRGSN